MKWEAVRKASEQPKQQAPNLTGIPTQMKLDFERRSGLSFDDVRVHYNSGKPAEIGALAYTQGTQVYIGQGQEKHLRHELGHVAQQKTMPVPATVMKHGIAINSDPRLEEQADRAALPTPSSSIASYHAFHTPVLQGRFEGIMGDRENEELLADIERRYVVGRTIRESLLQHIQESRASDRMFSTVDDIVAGFSLKLSRKSSPAAYSYGDRTQYTGSDELYEPLRRLYNGEGAQHKPPTKNEIFRCIARLYDREAFTTIIEGEQFITDLQSVIRRIYVQDHREDDPFITKTDIMPAALAAPVPDGPYMLNDSDIPPALNIDNFILRHYTKGDSRPTFSTIKSALSLEHQNVSTSSGGHTEHKDWNKLGNIGNTFFILLVDGAFVCKQRFIDHCKYYTDIPMSSITTSMWVSSDWLDESSIKGTAYRGNAAEIHKRLIQEVFEQFYGGDADKLASFRELTADGFAGLLGRLYNNFEVKVTGPVNVTEWYAVT